MPAAATAADPEQHIRAALIRPHPGSVSTRETDAVEQH